MSGRRGNAGRNSAGEDTAVRIGEGGSPVGFILFLIVVVGLAVWQFGSLTPGTPDFPSDDVTAQIEGNYVALYNPTNSIVDYFTLNILRLSGKYTFTEHNLRPRSVKRIPLKKLRSADGKVYDPEEDGECRLLLEWSIGGEAHQQSRYCRQY